MDIKQFTESDIAQITEAIRKAEENTSGEIRVVIIAHCEQGLFGDTYAQARRAFSRLGMDNTKDKTGVLLLVVTEEQKFSIIGDTGIHEKLPPDYWEKQARILSSYFKNGRFADGISEVVAEVGKQLAAHFPRKSDDTNELPNEPVIGGVNE